MNKVVPVVYAVNDKYFAYLCVSVSSLITCSSKNIMYEIYILTTDFRMNLKEKIKELETDNVHIYFEEMKDIVEGDDLREYSFFSKEAYYRLYSPKVLKRYARAIYLDCDTVILQDVAKLMEINMNGFTMAAVIDVNARCIRNHCERIGLDIKSYVNSGVLVIDLHRFESCGIKEKCLRILAEDYNRNERMYIFPDQDILNIVLKNEIYYLDDRWNFQWQHLWRLEDVEECYRLNYEKNKDNPWILHYAGDIKPLYYPWYPMASIFWEKVFELKICKDVMKELIVALNEDAELIKQEKNCFLKWKFPYKQIPPDSKVALYGAGEVGRDFYKQLIVSDYATVVIWVDKNFDKQSKIVNKPEVLFERIDYQYIVIAVADKDIAFEITNYLVDGGVSAEHIIWRDYRKVLNKR